MKSMRWLRFCLLLTIVAPPAARAQFETLRLVDLPPVGSWAEYQVLRRNDTQRVVVNQRVAYLGRQVLGSEAYDWFQIEMESDDYGDRRIPVVTQIALRHEDTLSRQEYFRKIQEMIVQAGGARPFRIGREFLALGIQKKLLSGGQGGAGSDVSYAYRDLPGEAVKTKAGEFACEHKKGLGKAEVVLSVETGDRFTVDSVLEVWYDRTVPFGLVRQTTKQSGNGPSTDELQLAIDSEEVVELIACGTGATGSIHGSVIEYDPSLAGRLTPGKK